MRTKTLLIAAAALAAAVTSSNAQTTVYSQNIVGYVNQVFSGAQGYSMAVNPLQGATNTADAVLPAIQPGDAILFWTGNSFSTFFYEPGLGNPNWVDEGFNPVTTPTLNAGQAFFYQNNQGASFNETNTYTGTCVLSNTVVLSGAQGYSLVGSTPPVAGTADDPATINLPVQPGDAVLLWTSGGFVTYFYEPGLGSPNWVDEGFNPVAAPAISVGQGFFYQNNQGSSVNETWTQNLNVQ